MSIANRILAISLSLSLMFLILELIRRKKLKEKYAILWIFSGIVILVLAVFEKVLSCISVLLGIRVSTNTVFFFGIFFIILINLHFSLVISSLSEQNKKIAQKLALLETKVKNSNDKE